MGIVRMMFFAVVTMGFLSAAAYASDYQGNEKEESKSIFQKLSDLTTGDYMVKDKPLKKAGIFNVMADQVNEMKLSSPNAATTGTYDQSVSPVVNPKE